MKKIQKQKKPTLESLVVSLNESIRESRESKNERDLEYKKTQEVFRKLSKESARERAEYRRERREEHREFKESMKELKESQKETDRQIKETEQQLKEMSRELKESLEETYKVVREVSSQLGGIGNSNGDMAEEYFQSAFTKDPRLNGEIFDEIDFNLKLGLKKGQVGNEYDIVMVNGRSVAIIEIKYHFEIEKKKIKEVLSDIFNKVETFKTFYPEYKNYNFYLGIASLSFRKNIEKILQERGIAVIKQVGDKMVINSESLKVF